MLMSLTKGCRFINSVSPKHNQMRQVLMFASSPSSTSKGQQQIPSPHGPQGVGMRDKADCREEQHVKRGKGEIGTR